jgi:CRP-like cAMP-binding protein
MISPELLRRYPFFGPFEDKEQKEIAMMAEERDVAEGTVLFEIDSPADAFYLLISGGVDLYDISIDEHDPSLRKEFFVGEVDPGEMLSISALVEPYQNTAQARVNNSSHIVYIDAARLRAFSQESPAFGYKLMHQVARLALDRLAETRVMLAGMQA